jgi:putative transposase
MVACDFFTGTRCPSAPLRALLHRARYRRVHLVGATSRPTGAWVSQQARNLLMRVGDALSKRRFLIRDRDATFTAGFNEVFRSEQILVIRTPLRAPRVNAFAERFVGTIRRECLDRMLIFSQPQLEAVLTEYVDHYNGHRPHRSLEQRAPLSSAPTLPPASPPGVRQLRRSGRLGGLIHEYELAG